MVDSLQQTVKRKNKDNAEALRARRFRRDRRRETQDGGMNPPLQVALVRT